MNAIALLRSIVLALLLVCVSAAHAHSYPEDGFTIIHPWVMEAPKGTPVLSVSMVIVEVSKDDRLIAASTPIAAAMELRSPDGNRPVPGVALQAGRDLVMSPLTHHFVLREVNTDLKFGFEYPLTLVFERAGEISAALIVGEH